MLQLIVNGLITGSVLALAAVGLTLVVGILRLLHVAHAEALTIGAFVGVAANVGYGISMIPAALIAITTVALLSLALEYVLWRPARRRGAGFISLLLMSIGLGFVLRHIVFMAAGAQTRRFDIDVFQVYTAFGVRLSKSQLIALIIAAVTIPLIGLLFAKTRLGKAMRALSDDRNLAAIAGVNPDRIINIVWILGGGLAGLAGLLQGLLQNAFDPNIGFTLLLPVFAALIVGGIGNPYGALVGGLTIGLAMEVSTWHGFAGGVPTVYKSVVAFVVLIAMLLWRPQGILGKARTV